MKEKDWQARVVSLAEAFGWSWWHVGMPMRPVGAGRFVPDRRGAGLPDLVLIHANPPRLILAELKDEKHDLEPEQEEFLRLARGVQEYIEGCLYVADLALLRDKSALGVYVWRPGDEAAVEAVLRTKNLSSKEE